MKFLFSIAACAALINATPASAEPVAARRSQIVRYADLDLTKQADVAALDRRIRLAIHEACGTASDADMRGKNQVRRCRALTSRLVAASRSQALASAKRPSTEIFASQK